MNRRSLTTLVLAFILALVLLTPVSAQSQDIVDIAAGNEDFSTLVAAVSAAGLVDTLKSEGPFTVFAPTNAAFEALGQDTIDALLADPSGDLTQILLYHVVPGKIMAADVTDGLEAMTAQGSTVKFTVTDGKVTINGANIITTDIEASNGVIHVIDAVITPPAADAMADAAPTSMPVTGGNFGSLPMIFVVVGATVAGLAGASWVSRRRQA